MTGRIARLSGPRVTALLYALAVAVMGLRAGQPGTLSWWLGALPFLAWCALPVVVGLWVHRWFSGLARAFYLLAIAAIAGGGFALQWYVMFIGPADAQNALILVFAPLVQWVLVACATALAGLLNRYVFKS